VIPSSTYANPFSFIFATNPVLLYEIPSFAIFVAASSSFRNFRLYCDDRPRSRRYSRGSNGRFGAAFVRVVVARRVEGVLIRDPFARASGARPIAAVADVGERCASIVCVRARALRLKSAVRTRARANGDADPRYPRDGCFRHRLAKSLGADGAAADDGRATRADARGRDARR
jgi:hypothetical protein